MNYRTLFWQGYALIGSLVFQPVAWAELAGGIATDGTMGAAQVLGGANVTVPQNLGTTVGSNLFHSFSEFNIAPGQSVDFTGSDALQNVISRVTGSNPSDIEGTLKSSIANAAFYFINPNGITFGANAQVDVPGAFHVSTADKIDFPNNSGAFYAAGNQASTLSSEAPAAFGFLDTSSVNNGLIAVDGAQLTVKTGQTLDMVAGEIDVKNYASVNAPAGEIRLAALQGSGGVGLQQTVDGVLPLPAVQPSAGNAGRIALDSSSAGASGDGGGRISLWGDNVSLVNNAMIYVDNEGDSDATPAKGIDIRSHTLSVDKSLVAFDAYWGTGKAGSVSVASQDIDIFNGGTISSNSFSAGDAGTVEVVADTLRIDGQGGSGQTGIASDAAQGSSGDAGGVIVSAKNLEIANGGTISSNTFSSGDAGGIVVEADTLRIHGQGGSGQTGIASDAAQGSSGDAGGVAVSAKSLEILNIGSISSNTWSTGDAGAVLVDADRLRIDGQGNTEAATGIFTGVYSSEQNSGDAGGVIVSAGNLDIVNGGTISSNTWSSGDAGAVIIEADALRIDGQGSNKQTGIASDAVKSSTGNAGGVIVSVKNLDIVNAGTISSDTWSSGDAGGIVVEADTLRIDGQGNNKQTGIASDATEGSSGNAGGVVISAKNLDIVNGGTISSDTLSSGDAGGIVVEADTLRIDGQGGSGQTGIASDATEGSSGNAGGVAVSAKNLEILNIGSISSNTWSTGDAGAVLIDANKLRIDGQGNTEAGTGIFTGVYSTDRHSGNGGDLAVRAGALDIFKGGTISSSTFSEGSAGQVFVEADTLNIDSQGFSAWATGISAEATDTSGGQTGNVLVNASSIVRLLDGGKISIENAGNPDNSAAIIPGSITITAPDIVMKNSEISSTSSGNVAAGNIVLNFSHWLTMDPSFISTMANTGNGGSITINGGEAIYLENSGFSTTVSGADSNGGDITTKADILAMNNGVIQANAVGGSGGNINLNLKSLIPSGNTLIKGGPAVDWQPFEAGLNVIQAASQAGVNGEVNVTAPQLNLSGIIANLGGPQFETGIIAQDYCGVGTGSSLTRKGAGGVKPKSGDQLPF